MRGRHAHLHTLALDGVYERTENGRIRFRAVSALNDAEVARVTTRIARSLEHMLTRRGIGPEADPNEADPLSCNEPLLAGISAASIRQCIATGRRAGQPVLRLGDRIDANDLPEVTGPLCANWNGVSLHAAVCVPAQDRGRLERLVRYVARLPLLRGMSEKAAVE